MNSTKKKCASLLCLQGVFGHVVAGDVAFVPGAGQLGSPPLSRPAENTPANTPAPWGGGGDSSARRGNSLLQDFKTIPLLEAEVTVMDGLVVVQRHGNRLTCCEKSPGEWSWSSPEPRRSRLTDVHRNEEDVSVAHPFSANVATEHS